LAESPYRRTAFRIARVPREVVRHRTVVQIIGQTSQVVAAGSGQHVVLGRIVTTEEVNWAQQILLDPRQRLREELVEHASERAPVEALRKLDRRAAELMAPAATGGAPGALAFLRPHVSGLCDRCGTAAPPVDPSFGALELEPAAPFGDVEDL
jgi:hypothetical protein